MAGVHPYGIALGPSAASDRCVEFRFITPAPVPLLFHLGGLDLYPEALKSAHSKA